MTARGQRQNETYFPTKIYPSLIVCSLATIRVRVRVRVRAEKYVSSLSLPLPAERFAPIQSLKLSPIQLISDEKQTPRNLSDEIPEVSDMTQRRTLETQIPGDSVVTRSTGFCDMQRTVSYDNVESVHKMFVPEETTFI